MQSEIDLFLTCFMAGAFGGGVIMLLMTSHFKYMYKRYLDAKEIVKDVAHMRQMQTEIQRLKIAVADMNKEFYARYEKEA